MMVWMVKIVHNKRQGVFVEPVATYLKAFSTKEKAKEWLIQKGFVYGKCKYFKDSGESYWFNQSDISIDHTVVSIHKMEVDSDEESWIDDLTYRRLLEYI